MYVLSCPRCGLPVAYIGRERHRPYCKDCGWILNLGTRGSDKQHHFFPGMIIGIALLVAFDAALHDIPWHAFLFVYGGLGTVTAAGVFGIRNNTSRTNNLLRAVASKPGAELSSTAPEITPAKVIGFAESLHSLPRPRQTRLNAMSRVTIWILRIVPVFGNSQ